jgi:hypothetical protein
MINSLQREDFPDRGVSFVYVTHIYCTKNTAEESPHSRKDFEDFFKKMGMNMITQGILNPDGLKV